MHTVTAWVMNISVAMGSGCLGRVRAGDPRDPGMEASLSLAGHGHGHGHGPAADLVTYLHSVLHPHRRAWATGPERCQQEASGPGARRVHVMQSRRGATRPPASERVSVRRARATWRRTSRRVLYARELTGRSWLDLGGGRRRSSAGTCAYFVGAVMGAPPDRPVITESASGYDGRCRDADARTRTQVRA